MAGFFYIRALSRTYFFFAGAGRLGTAHALFHDSMVWHAHGKNKMGQNIPEKEKSRKNLRLFIFDYSGEASFS